jgi:hypothetical protein
MGMAWSLRSRVYEPLQCWPDYRTYFRMRPRYFPTSVRTSINNRLHSNWRKSFRPLKPIALPMQTIVRKWEETLGVNFGLRPQRYELFRTFVTLHFGRPDLIGRIITSFVGFAASSEGGLHIPNYNEFLEGRPYLILDDSSIVFSAKPLP